MKEIDLFKKCFKSKKIIWVRGPEGSRQKQILFQLFSCTHVSLASVCKVSAQQFIGMIELGTVSAFAQSFSVLMIDEFEHLPHEVLERFLKSLTQYSNFKSFYSFRVALLSGSSFELAKKFETKLKPAIFNILGVGEDPSDMNERVHAVLEIAAQITKKKITRVSEYFMRWIENQNWTLHDEELLVIFILAIQQMKTGSILKFQHLDEARESFEATKAEVRVTQSI